MGLLNKLWKQWHNPTDEHGHEALMVSNETFHYVPHFINGERLLVESSRYLDVVNPCSGLKERRIHVAEAATIEKAIQVAKEGLFLWSGASYLERVKVIEQFKSAFFLQQKALSEVLKQEGGFSDAMVNIEIELTVEAIMYAMTNGQPKDNAAPNWGNVDVWIQHSMGPIGVVVIAIDEQQTIISLVSEVVVALLCGNAVVVKPYEGQPVLAILLGDWLSQAGLPNGAYNVLQGDAEVIHCLHQHPCVSGISYLFLEPNPSLKPHLRQRQTTKARNVIVLDRDVDLDHIWSQFVAGPRVRLSMPFWIVIGDDAQALTEQWMHYLQSQAAVILPSSLSRQKNIDLLQQAVLAGADLLHDGSHVPAPEHGWYMGKSLLVNVTPEMGLHQLPVNPLAVMIMRVPDVSAAVDVINEMDEVGGVSLFTGSMTSMGRFKQVLTEAEVISFNRMALVPSLSLPRGDINYVWAVGGQHASRWHFYSRQQLIMGEAI